MEITEKQRTPGPRFAHDALGTSQGGRFHSGTRETLSSAIQRRDYYSQLRDRISQLRAVHIQLLMQFTQLLGFLRQSSSGIIQT